MDSLLTNCLRMQLNAHDRDVAHIKTLLMRVPPSLPSLLKKEQRQQKDDKNNLEHNWKSEMASTAAAVTAATTTTTTTTTPISDSRNFHYNPHSTLKGIRAFYA